jgi:hypothetical protein
VLTLHLPREDKPEELFSILMDLQNLDDKIIPLPAILRSTLKTVISLEELTMRYNSEIYPLNSFERVLHELSNHKARLTEHMEGLEALQQKARGNQNLVCFLFFFFLKKKKKKYLTHWLLNCLITIDTAWHRPELEAPSHTPIYQ